MEIASSSSSISEDNRQIGGTSSALKGPVEEHFPSSSSSPACDQEKEGEEGEDEDQDICRICRNAGEADNPLRFPCACSGTIKYVHQDCLLQWINHSNARQCEVCKHAFYFSPVYANGTPVRLPFLEFVIGMAMKACHILQFILRFGFVLAVWLLIIPFITFWIWRLAFVRSFGEAQRIFFSHMSATVVFIDCLHGFLLSASIVFIFLGATSLRDYMRHMREHGNRDERDVDGHDRHVARAVRRPVGLANRVHAGDGLEDAGIVRGIGGLRRNGENVPARLEMQAARLEARVEEMFDGLDDGDGAEDVPFDELVGLEGPLFHLVENAITVLASNAIFLSALFFLPFSLGRIVLYCFSTSSPLLSLVMPLTESVLFLSKGKLKSTLTVVTSGSGMGLLGSAVEVLADALNINTTGLNEISNSFSWPASSDPLRGAAVDATTLAIGYMFLSSLVFLYIGTIAIIRLSRGMPLMTGSFHRVVSLVGTIPSLIRQFLSVMKHLMTMLKVSFLLVTELGVFPLMCGWWLDVCTIRMVGTTIAQRVDFFSASPLASSLLHWLIGIMYMLQISIFVSLLRGVLRKGVLYFLRDPADPNYNPFRDLIDDPIQKHARRVLLSVSVYGSLIVMLVFLPVKLAMWLAPSVFPLDISVSDPFTEIPAGMLLVHIFVPFAVEHFKPRTIIQAVLRQWFTIIGWTLGLTDFLLPSPDGNGRPENGYAEPVRQDRLHDMHLGRAVQENRALFALVQARNMDAGEADLDDSSDGEDCFVFRIVLLLLLAWMTLLFFNSAMIIVPVALGRSIFNFIPCLPISHGIKCNDLYAFSIGCYVIWTAIAGIRYSFGYLKQRKAWDLPAHMWRWSVIFLKSAALLSLWIFVIPVLIGLLFELLVIVPMRVPIDESPVFLLYQDWALGLVFFKIWTRLVMLDQMALLVDDTWKTKFEMVRRDGFSQLKGMWVLREILVPILMKLLTALSVPYVFAKGFFPMLGCPLLVNSAVYRFAWPGCLLLTVMCFCGKRFHVWFTNLHNSIRDDRYLIGRRLQNYRDGKDSEHVGGPHDDHISDSGIGRNEEEVNHVLRLRHANRPNPQ